MEAAAHDEHAEKRPALLRGKTTLIVYSGQTRLGESPTKSGKRRKKREKQTILSAEGG